MDGIIRLPKSLGHQSRYNSLGDTRQGLYVDHSEISRTQQGNQMRRERTNQEIAGAIAYAVGYIFVMATFVKLAWWVWQQPW